MGRPSGWLLPEVLRERLVNEVVGIVLVDLDLFEDDALFAFEVALGKVWVQDEVAQDVERRGHVLIEYLDVEADAFLAGEGVQVAADRVDLAGDILCGAAGGAFEDHVLDEVRQPVLFGGLVARAAVDPGAHGDAAHVRHAFGEDQEAVGEGGLADVARGMRRAGGAGLGQCGGCGHAAP